MKREAERRIYPRVDVKLAITRLGTAMNISEGGICVLVDDALPIDYLIELNVSLPILNNDYKKESSKTLKLEGVVVWNKYSELLDKYEIGIKFTNMQNYNKAVVNAFIERYTQNNPQSGWLKK